VFLPVQALIALSVNAGSKRALRLNVCLLVVLANVVASLDSGSFDLGSGGSPLVDSDGSLTFIGAFDLAVGFIVSGESRSHAGPSSVSKIT